MSKVTALLLALLVSLPLSGFAAEGSTKFKNLRVTGTLTVDGATTQTGGVTTTAPFTPYSRTIAQLNALAPTVAGQIVFCSNCTVSSLCVSSGTVAGSWTTVSVSTTATGAYTTVHCQ